MVGLLLARRDAAQIHQRYSADGLDENQRPADAGGWLPLRGKSGHARAVDRSLLLVRTSSLNRSEPDVWIGL
jgi:hypothetical protein